ncbi:SH3 domain-containing protein [Pararhizobium sp. BT-229]|uniref:SH3 domain-containing protein n=1 Tax=Pararhizobium sp. BT-229 TaxID=2986923 RepID=UPI0021F6CD92|nr:SH3 domain-containing protein [Pararhizobium sp. BT-229]MCV9962160.1 SH3 domain-containing protein [Pararhizobium sp. BT-229]
MRRNRIIAAAILAVFTGGAAPAFGAACIVADPTGTPLNVRDEPNGQILSTLDNGLALEVVGETRSGGKRWVKVTRNGEPLGWVFADFLDCSSSEEDMKSAPMHPRTAPQ